MKNAGSTISAVLRREFREHFHEMDSEDCDGEFTAPELVEYLLSKPDIRAISSHQIRFPRIEHKDMIAFECCAIRHPLDRLHSLYRYLRVKPTGLALSHYAREYDLRGFLSQLLASQPHLICNVQTTVIANGGRFTRPADRGDLRRAAATIRKIAMPAVVDRLDESLVAAEYFLQPAFGGIQLHHAPENVTRSMASTQADRDRQFKALCGDAVYAEVRRMQELDLALFEAATEEVARRTALVPGFEARLIGFRDRTRPMYATAVA